MTGAGSGYRGAVIPIYLGAFDSESTDLGSCRDEVGIRSDSEIWTRIWISPSARAVGGGEATSHTLNEVRRTEPGSLIAGFGSQDLGFESL